MAKGLPYTMGRATAEGLAPSAVVVQPFKFKDKSLTMTDGNPAWGTVAIGDLPEGNLLIVGAVLNLEVEIDDADVADDFDGDFAVGSAPTADGSLAGAEVDIIPSTSTIQAVDQVSTGNRGVLAAPVTLDNTDGSKELNLQLLVDDADSSGASTAVASGVLYLAYAVLGDD